MRRVVAVLAAAVMAAACERPDDSEAEAEAPGELAWATEDAGGSIIEDFGAIQPRLQAQLDSIDRALRRVPNLTAAEKRALRRDVNELQIARARQLGLRVTGAVEPHVASKRLVRLEDSTSLWVLRELDYSIPYVTPDAHAMLVELGQRFHARLDSLGIPRYRLDITSVLRTPATQAELRRRNANASRTESSHEYATTVDIAYRRFAAPAQPLEDVRLTGLARTWADSMYVDVGRDRGAELQAILGRVIREMQQEGRLMVVMERRQTVYHITVARRYPR